MQWFYFQPKKGLFLTTHLLKTWKTWKSFNLNFIPLTTYKKLSQ